MPKQKRHASRVYQTIGEPGPGALAAGYARYSSEMQDLASIITQKGRIQEFAAAKGWTIVRMRGEGPHAVPTAGHAALRPDRI